MSLRFHYKLVPTGYSVLTLGGRFVRPRPIVPITVFGPAGNYSVRAFLDPGSDETVFEEGLAAAIGVDLTNASVGRATGIGLVGSVLRYAQVSMQITDLFLVSPVFFSFLMPTFWEVGKKSNLL